jgi:putative acetyltransferase
MISIRPETSADIDAIRDIIRQAFGQEEESRLVDLLREGGYARLSLVATIDNDVVGHVMFSELSIATDNDAFPALALAPLAVTPAHQRRGIGSQLVREGLAACEDLGHRIVIVLGDPAFYSRFGFSTQRAERLRSRYSGPHFMALELVAGALDGVHGDVFYSRPFDMF